MRSDIRLTCAATTSRRKPTKLENQFRISLQPRQESSTRTSSSRGSLPRVARSAKHLHRLLLLLFSKPPNPKIPPMMKRNLPSLRKLSHHQRRTVQANAKRLPRTTLHLPRQPLPKAKLAQTVPRPTAFPHPLSWRERRRQHRRRRRARWTTKLRKRPKLAQLRL